MRTPSFAEALARPANGFGAVRLALALSVVVSHAFSVTTGQVADEPLRRLTGFTLGEHAVDGFFAVSGFLVAMSFARRGPRDYAVSRALRIVPGFVVAALAVTLGLGSALTRLDLRAYWVDPATWRYLGGLLATFKTNAALPGVFPDNPLRLPMGTVWTLKYEVICYAALLAAGLAGTLRSRWPATMLAVLLFVGTVALEIDAKGRETALRLPFLFATGSALFLWSDRLRVSAWPLLGLAAAAVLAHATPAYRALLFAAEAYGVIWVALSAVLARPLFDPRHDLSYGIYLYGWPVQQALVQLHPGASAAALLAPALAVTIAIAALSWFAVERPALAQKRRLLRSLQPEPP